VVKSFPSGGGVVTILKGISFDVKNGEFVSIVGPSGNGKSTLLNMITGIDRPSDGEVIVTGREVHRMSENQLAAWRGQHVGIVFQFFQMLPSLSLLQNIILPMDLAKKFPGRQRSERAMHLLETVGLADQAHKLPGMFSQLVEQGKTMVMVTHDKELARRVPRVVEIIDGKITRDEFVGGADWTGY
jgi:putative ABC transport system ATP-binding protein